MFSLTPHGEIGLSRIPILQWAVNTRVYSDLIPIGLIPRAVRIRIVLLTWCRTNKERVTQPCVIIMTASHLGQEHATDAGPRVSTPFMLSHPNFQR